ncbi:MAG: type II secretion system protein GspL [Gallionellaceae bacterium]|jgi:general secretion pathway protein L
MKLRIYFSSSWHDSASPCPWALCDDSGAVVQSGQTPLAAMPKADDYLAIIAATKIMCVTVQMPASARRRWEAALPFVAEEFTLTDPEENHVVPGEAQKDASRSLFIVDKQWIKNIISACHSAGIALRCAVPEMLLPVLPENSWVLVWDGEKGFMRTGASSGMALDKGDATHPPLALSLSLTATTPQNIQIRLTDHAALPASGIPVWPELAATISAGEPWDWQREPIPANTLNLLWGPLAPPAKIQEWLPKFRPLAFILLAALVIETIGTNLEWGLLQREKNQITAAMERTFRKAFGETSVVVNPPLQMQRNIAVLRHNTGMPDEADFLPLLDQTTSLLAALPTGTLRGMHYSAGRLDLDLKLGNETALKSLQKSLINKGLNAKISDMRDTGNGVEARLEIRTGGMQ